MDLIRDLLIYFEDNLPEKGSIVASEIKLGDYSSAEIVFHVKLLTEEKLIDFTDLVNYYGYNCLILSLSYSGYEFLSALRNDTVWNKVKETSKNIGIEAIKATVPLLISYAKLQLDLS